MAEIVQKKDVPRWEQGNYDQLRISPKTPDNLQSVNDSVKAICENITSIVEALGQIKTALGENTGSLPNISNVMSDLQTKQEEIKKKNVELIQVCYAILNMINQNKETASAEAQAIQQALTQLSIYQ